MGYTLAYDSDCGPCSRFRWAVGFLDPAHKMRYVSLAEAEEAGALAAIPRGARRRSFHLISDDGSGLSAAEALPTLASLLPGGAFTSRAMRSSRVVYGAAAFAYGALSRLHDSGACTRA